MEKNIAEQIDAKIAGYDERFGRALDQIELAVALVRNQPSSCTHYTGALIMIDEAGGQSDEASVIADRTRKEIDDAHLTAIGDGVHDLCCAFSPPNSAHDVWDSLE